MKPHGTYDTAFQAGAASRDAEIAALNSQVERLQGILARRLIGLCKCKEERSQLREQVKLLRESLRVENLLRLGYKYSRGVPFSSTADAVLAATEQKL